MHQAVFVPVDHPLLGVDPLTLRDIAAYPIITYDRDYTSRDDIERAFSDSEVRVHVVISATDAEIMKTFVFAGIGVGIMALASYDQAKDSGLRAMDAEHLFKPRTVQIGTRRDGRLPPHALRFLELFAPRVHAEIVRRTVDLI
jgi:LysR family cys regulon transcriptional activator